MIIINSNYHYFICEKKLYDTIYGRIYEPFHIIIQKKFGINEVNYFKYNNQYVDSMCERIYSGNGILFYLNNVEEQEIFIYRNKCPLTKQICSFH